MKTALLVIDFINGIIGGSCKDFAEKYPIIENTNKLIAACKQKGIPVYFIRLAYDDHYTNLPKHSKSFNRIKKNGYFQLGSESTEFVSQLDFEKTDCVINKTAASPFHSKGLTENLVKNGIEKLIFTGVATDNAINIGAREANDTGYYTVIAKDACGASREDFHVWSIEMLQKIVNEIKSTEEVLLDL